MTLFRRCAHRTQTIPSYPCLAVKSTASTGAVKPVTYLVMRSWWRCIIDFSRAKTSLPGLNNHADFSSIATCLDDSQLLYLQVDDRAVQAP